ncbi:hypothetical protein K0A97_01155 [Patescibacteria group bacterium]|nr:hypothetical protein [Patescibacteria group bacterium]
MEKEFKKIRKFEGEIHKRGYVLIQILIQITLVIAIFLSIYEKNWINILVISLTLLLIYLPKLFSKKFQIFLPLDFQTLMVLFIYMSIFLGEIGNFYEKFIWWDSILHLTSGIALGFVGFLLLYVLYRSGKFKSDPIWVAIFSFCFSVTLGVLWEIFEFWMDSIFGLNMQRAIFSLEVIKTFGSSRIAIYDTMQDFILNGIGAFIASVSSYIYLKKRGMLIFGSFVKNFEDKNPRLFKNKKYPKRSIF